MTQRYFPKRSSISTRTNKPEVPWGVTPNYNGAWQQVAQTNNEIVKQSDKASWEAETGIVDLDNENNVRHAYSECSAINRTGEYMINNMSDGDGVLSHVGGNVALHCSSAIRYPRWMNNSDYDIIGEARAGNKTLIKLNVLTGDETVLADFSAYDYMDVGKSQGVGDILDDRIALTVKDGNDLIIVVWSLISDSEVSRKVLTNGWTITDNVTISRLGNYVIRGLDDSVTDYAMYNASDMSYVRDLGLNGHGVMALDAAGNEVWVQFVRVGSYRAIRMYNLDAGTSSLVLGDGTSQFENGYASSYEALTGHLGFAPLRPGYVLWSNNDPQGPHTVAWVPLDGSQNIEWLCDHQSDEASGYYAEPQASPSFTGTEVAFASNKRIQNGPISTYLVRAMASKCPTITTTTFEVEKDSQNGTIVGQLVATYDSSNVATGWRLHNNLNTAFAVSDAGVITVADSSKIGTVGDQTIDVIVEGVDGQTADYITIDVTTASPLGSQANPLNVTVLGGRQSFPALGVAPSGSTLVAVGDLPSDVAAKDGFGHFMYISASYGLGFEARKTVTMANLQPYLTNSDFKGAIFNLFWKDFWLYEPFMQELLNALRPYGKTMWVEIDDIKFNASSLPLSSAPVPQYIKDNGWTAYSGPASNAAICSTMATETDCRLALFSDITEIFAKWDNDPALAGLIFPESTRSHAASVGGANVDVADEMIDLYISMYTELKPTFQKTLLVPGLNFVDSPGVTKFEELMDAMVAAGGACCFWPDTIEERDPLRPGGAVGYAYPFYAVARDYVDDVMILAGMQTRDIGANRDDCYELALADINTFPRSLQAHGILSWDWHADYSDWEDQVVAEVATWSGGHNTNYPTALNYKTGTATPATWSPDNGSTEKNLSNIDVTPTDAVDGDTDIVSIWTTTGGTAVENPIYITYSGQAPEVSDGTPTAFEFHDYEMGSGAHSVTSSHATREWSVNNTAIAGYSGSGYLQAEGYNTNAETDLGDTQRIPLDDLTAGKTFKAWNRVRAEDAGSDSLWLLKEGSNPQSGGDTFVTSALHGEWNWVPARDSVGNVLLLSSADIAYIGAVREKDLKWSKTLFVDANETAEPTGKDGFYTLDSKVSADAFFVAANQVGISLDVLANDDNGLTLLDIVGAPAHGQASIDVGNNVVLYSPDNGYIGDDSISYRAQDLDGNYYTAIASIDVAVSPPPITNTITVTDNGTGDLVVDFGAYISSPTGLNLTLTHFPDFPEYYTTSVTGLVVTYTSLVTPPVSFGGNYSITDSAGSWSSNSISATRLVPDNTDPSPATDTVTTTAGVPVVITPLSNDIDPDGHELTLLGLVDEPSNGIATITGNSITYVSNENFGGIEVLTYTVRDIYGASAEGTIKIAVVGPNGVGVRVGGVITATIRVQSK